jgi:two-component system, cell cycle response regulator
MDHKKLLVIDDAEPNLLLFDSMFENDERVEVLLRENGVGIVDYCLENSPDLILLDLMMPEIHGFDVLKMLKTNQELAKIPVVIISALEGPEDIKKGIELGALDYRIKPVDYEENYIMVLKLLELDYPPMDY